MEIREKYLIVYRLTLLWFFFLLFVKIIRYQKIFYLDMSNFFKDIHKMNSLEKFGFIWVKRRYQEYSDYWKSYSVAVELTDKVYEKTQLSYIHRIIEKYFNIVNDNQKEKMGIFWRYYIHRIMKSFADQYAAADFLSRITPDKSITILSFNFFAVLLKKDLKNTVKLLFLPVFYLSETHDRLFSFVLSKFKVYIHLLFRPAPSTPESIFQQTSSNAQGVDFKDYSVIYFPHQGIYYDVLFKKDHFYSNEMDSPLYKSKILHISLGEKNEDYMLENYKFYQENNIPFVDINDLDYDKKALRGSFVNLIFKLNVKICSDLYNFGLFYIFYTLLIFIRIKKKYLKFSNFKKLKLALAGYEYLFPRDLAMALTLLGVKIGASQERLIIAYFPNNYLILDYYFVANDIVKNHCQKTSRIDNYIPVGLVRVDNIYEYEKKQICDEKYDTIKKNHRLVIALDYYLPSNEIEDVNRDSAKISETRAFYCDLIRLANEFPSLFIVIKGKVLASYKSQYIFDLMEKIKQTNNLTIEMDLLKYDPYYITEKADLVIACHTSLCDELLAAGRKVIFYEISDRLKTLFDYEKLPIMVKDYEEMKYHIQNFLDEIYLSQDKIDRIKKMFFSDCYHGMVRKNIQTILENILVDQN